MNRYFEASVLLANSIPVKIHWLSKIPHTQSANLSVSCLTTFCIEDIIAGYVKME